MKLHWYDYVGLIGVASMLCAYGALQLRWLRPTGLAYSLLNALGAGLILFSLMFAFNLSAVVVEGAWLLISLYGLWRWRRRSRQHDALLAKRAAHTAKRT